MKSHPCSRDGFSLVEVTIAIGIAAFCLITIYGLLPVGLKSNQSAIQQTLGNSILSIVAADLKTTPLTAPQGEQPKSPQFLIEVPPSPLVTAVAKTIYFNGEGQYSATLRNDSRFLVTVTFIPNGANAPTATMATLKVSWPPGAPLDKATGSVQTFIALDRN